MTAAAMRLLERDFHLGFHRGMPLRFARLTSPLLAGAGVLSCTSKERLEEIAETSSAEHVTEVTKFYVDAAPARRRCKLGSVFPVCSELIVSFSLVRVRQDLVGFVDLLEFFLGGLIPRVQVRMVLSGEFAIGLPNLVVGGIALNPKDFVIILEFHHLNASSRLDTLLLNLREPNSAQNTACNHNPEPSYGL